MINKIFYIGAYSDTRREMKRSTAPAADTKINYILNSLKQLGYDIEVLSMSEYKGRETMLAKHKGYTQYYNDIPVHFFDSYESKIRPIRVIGRLLSKLKILNYISKNCLANNSLIIIYHSLGLLYLYNWLYRKKKSFILEVEEIYADVIGKQRTRQIELASFSKASAYIFPTELLSRIANESGKPEIIIHGTYQIEEKKEKRFLDKDIHCVYAGTFDPRKGGAAAAAAAEFLPENYHIHILGFGSEQEVAAMKKHIEEVQARSKAKVTYDGLLTGDEYICFIQSCDIGLSTQDPSAAFNATSFPSKILSYLANGLRVVSIRIPAIESSDISELMYYYDEQTPEEIAKAILSVNMNEPYNCRERIRALSEKFKIELNKLLEES